MDRGRGGRDFGFGDPFAGFGGFGRPGSLMSSFFGGRDPFDDPFFTQPFGGLMGPSMFGEGMFGRSMLPDRGSLFVEPSNAGFLDQAPPVNKSKGPIIRELSSDDEDAEGEQAEKDKRENPRKRSSAEPYVQDPDEETEEKKSRYVDCKMDFNQSNPRQPQGRTFSFQSSTVTYGGLNGAYYTSSTSRRTGSDGLTLEERKEADTTTGKAAHRIARGLGNKGHSVTRKLNSDGRVDTMETLHNLNEDELSAFEQSWKGNARENLPGWTPGLDMLGNGNTRGDTSRQGQARGWALPSTERRQEPQRVRSGPRINPPKSRGSAS